MHKGLLFECGGGGGGGGTGIWCICFVHIMSYASAKESLQTGCSLVADHVVAMKDEVRFWSHIWVTGGGQAFCRVSWIVGAILKSVLYFFQSRLQPRSENVTLSSVFFLRSRKDVPDLTSFHHTVPHERCGNRDTWKETPSIQRKIPWW